ncbi:hypothetical protein M378DRAFT_163739 [Amanita muscaria Koide BX008]|uniref:Uncharacterized protein n=1 Tax=Amanita muscaria (strain Koide BX008) TaxID=946122 RepID=A0A0C2SLK3_AMAMK|nr:hypothetical protein M378DRAFT_163739 [Amanita muscaria Koide BX008]
MCNDWLWESTILGLMPLQSENRNGPADQVGMLLHCFVYSSTPLSPKPLSVRANTNCNHKIINLDLNKATARNSTFIQIRGTFHAAATTPVHRRFCDCSRWFRRV